MGIGNEYEDVPDNVDIYDFIADRGYEIVVDENDRIIVIPPFNHGPRRIIIERPIAPPVPPPPPPYLPPPYIDPRGGIHPRNKKGQFTKAAK